MNENKTYIEPGAEIDLSGEGLQPTTCDFLIVKAEILDTEHGQKWQATFEPTGAPIDGLPNNQVKDNGFLSYDGPSEHDLAKIGRGILKRLFQAALGTDRGSIPALEGAIVNARVREDNAGFARIGNYRAPKA